MIKQSKTVRRKLILKKSLTRQKVFIADQHLIYSYKFHKFFKFIFARALSALLINKPSLLNSLIIESQLYIWCDDIHNLCSININKVCYNAYTRFFEATWRFAKDCVPFPKIESYD